MVWIRTRAWTEKISFVLEAMKLRLTSLRGNVTSTSLVMHILGSNDIALKHVFAYPQFLPL